jgi:hypothetical protein
VNQKLTEPIAILIGGAVIGADRPRGVQSIDMGISFLGAGFVVTRCDLTTVFDGQLNWATSSYC